MDQSLGSISFFIKFRTSSYLGQSYIKNNTVHFFIPNAQCHRLYLVRQSRCDSQPSSSRQSPTPATPTSSAPAAAAAAPASPPASPPLPPPSDLLLLRPGCPFGPPPFTHPIWV